MPGIRRGCGPRWMRSRVPEEEARREDKFHRSGESSHVGCQEPSLSSTPRMRGAPVTAGSVKRTTRRMNQEGLGTRTVCRRTKGTIEKCDKT